MSQAIWSACALVSLLVGLTKVELVVLRQRNADASSAVQSRQDVGELVPGMPIERELAGGETHAYQITLALGQYLHVVVDQRGVDVVVTLFGPNGQQLTDFDSRWHGPEPVSLAAEASGTYRLELRPVEKGAVIGRYEMRIEELREAAPQDKSRIAAERASAEGKKLIAQGTAESLRKALPKYEEALPLWRAVGDRHGEAQAFNSIGYIYNALGQQQKALDYYGQALPLWRAVGYLYGEAETLHNIGAAYSALGKKQEALSYYGQALPLRRAVGDPRGEAQTLNNLGVIYSLLGENQKALDHFSQALLLWRTANDRRGQANTLISMGVIHSLFGDIQKALDHFGQALPPLRAVGDRRGEAYTLHNIGGVYKELGEKKKALDYYNQALPLMQAVGDRRGEAQTLHNIGAVYNELGENQKALKYYGQVLSLWRAVQDRYGEAYTLHNFGKVYDDLGEKQTALDYFGHALQLMRDTGNRRGEAYTLHNFGKVYASLGEKQKALDYYGQALQLSRTVGDRSTEAATLYGIARVERDGNHLTEACTQMEAALKLIEFLRTKVPSEELRASYLALQQKPYEFYIDLLMRLHQREPTKGHDAVALQASERARARSLLELLAEAKIDVQQGIDPALKQRERATQARISQIQRQLIQAHSQMSPDKTKIATLEEELKTADGEREQLEMEIRQKHPQYAALQYPTPLGLKEIQALLDDQTALLEYSLGQDASFLFVITKDDFQVARLPPAPSLSDRVKMLRETIVTTPRRTAYLNYVTHARWLYHELIHPASKLLAGKRELIIAPDGILHYLPFEVLLASGEANALIQSDPSRWPYLVRDYAISYVPSASVLASLHDHRPEPARSRMFVAFADPVYGANELEETTIVRAAVRSAFGEAKPWKLERLRYSRQEVRRIAKLYPDDEVTLFLRAQASEENVKVEGRLSQYRFIHFAAHGILNESQPQFSGLVLSLPQAGEDPKPKTQDSRPTNRAEAAPNPQSAIRNRKTVCCKCTRSSI